MVGGIVTTRQQKQEGWLEAVTSVIVSLVNTKFVNFLGALKLYTKNL